MKQIVTTLLLAILCWQHASAQQYRAIRVDAPFRMPVIREYVYPDSRFPIDRYGALSVDNSSAVDDRTVIETNTRAFAAAIRACNEAGGGYVIVPQGRWLCGPIHLRSNVNLRLEEGSVVEFSDNPSDYLPAVQSSWEGMECMNYSPLIYAYDCKNVAISGTGLLAPRMDVWRTWFARPQAHMDGSALLYRQASTDVPVSERQMAQNDYHFRPQLIQLNRCENVLLEDFQVRESPFWTIHLLLCKNGVARRLRVYAHGHNNDGIDLEMTQDFLVEDCTFDQGDDAVVIKSGRNQDAWRLHTPSKNIVVRNCIIKNGHTLLGIGSELSGGIENVYMHDCQMTEKVWRLLYVKTNHRRGGVVKNITLQNIDANEADELLAIATDVLYQWKDLPTYATRYTKMSNITLRNVHMRKAGIGFRLAADPHAPVRNVLLDNVRVDTITQYQGVAHHVKRLRLRNVSMHQEE